MVPPVIMRMLNNRFCFSFLIRVLRCLTDDFLEDDFEDDFEDDSVYFAQWGIANPANLSIA